MDLLQEFHIFVGAQKPLALAAGFPKTKLGRGVAEQLENLSSRRQATRIVTILFSQPEANFRPPSDLYLWA